MKNLLISFFFILLFFGLSKAQKGTAEGGFYPPQYVGGQTWTGEVTAIDEDKLEITLTYRGKKKDETFTGVLSREFLNLQDRKGKNLEVKLPDLMGQRLKVYYSSKNKKDANGVKTKVMEIYIMKIVSKD